MMPFTYLLKYRVSNLPKTPQFVLGETGAADSKALLARLVL